MCHKRGPKAKVTKVLLIEQGKKSGASFKVRRPGSIYAKKSHCFVVIDVRNGQTTGDSVAGEARLGYSREEYAYGSKKR